MTKVDDLMFENRQEMMYFALGFSAAYTEWYKHKVERLARALSSQFGLMVTWEDAKAILENTKAMGLGA